MVTRRAIKGILRNFLGTYTSRYSAYNGYWLFGFLVRDVVEAEFDLLTHDTHAADKPLAVAADLARVKFKDQVRKARMDLSWIRNARVRMTRLPDATTGLINGHSCSGNNVSVWADAVMDNGREYESEQLVFVAPHDARVELRSARGP